MLLCCACLVPHAKWFGCLGSRHLECTFHDEFGNFEVQDSLYCSLGNCLPKTHDFFSEGCRVRDGWGRLGLKSHFRHSIAQLPAQKQKSHVSQPECA
jgi:hypothetical protein